MSECSNTPTDEETDYEEADPASLQIMTQNYCPIDSEGEAEYFTCKRQGWHHPIFATKSKDRWKSNQHTGQRGHVFDRETD